MRKYRINSLFPKLAQKFKKEIADFNTHNELCELETATGMTWEINDEYKIITPGRENFA